jgi:c-di-GMP-binding flagellar brake protein YcgR
MGLSKEDRQEIAGVIQTAVADAGRLIKQQRREYLRLAVILLRRYRVSTPRCGRPHHHAGLGLLTPPTCIATWPSNA